MADPRILLQNVLHAKEFLDSSPQEANSDAVDSERGRILKETLRICPNQVEASTYLSRAALALQEFAEFFPGSSEAYLVRAPGRVNLIGEHTDYNGLPVLPIAINRDVLIVCAPRGDSRIFVRNVSCCYEPASFEMSAAIEPSPMGNWANYAKAAAQALHSFFGSSGRPTLKGFNAVVDGNIPMAAGLSSSSALVVGFALATLYVNQLEIDRGRLAGLLAEAEHYVGTRGGGMDQTVCLLAEEGRALKIEFFPTRTETIPLPRDYSFVVCHSMVPAPKTSTVRFRYNMRAAESRIAAAMISFFLSEKSGAPKGIQRLGDLSSENGFSDAEIDALVERALTKDTYSIVEAASSLNLTEPKFRQEYLEAFDNEDGTSVSALKLRSRCRHVLSEGRRVRAAAEALKSSDIVEFGRLMNESHESCAGDYEISIPELDALVRLAREAGAMGSRLTGAGFGGCAVSLIKDSEIDRFRNRIEESYYGEYLSSRTSDKIEPANPSDRILVCKATHEAGLLFAP